MVKNYILGILIISCIIVLTACKNESGKNIQENKTVSEKVKGNSDISKNSSESQSTSSKSKVEKKPPANSEEAKLELLKQEVEKVHLQNIQYLIEGNAKKLVEVFSTEGYAEFNEIFKNEKPKLDESYFGRLFASDLYQRYKNKKLEEVLRLDKKSIRIYQKASDEINNSNFNRHMVFKEFVDGDANVQFMPGQDCPIILWDAFYRKTNGEWKLIASNFWLANYGDSMFKLK